MSGTFIQEMAERDYQLLIEQICPMCFLETPTKMTRATPNSKLLFLHIFKESHRTFKCKAADIRRFREQPKEDKEDK